MKYEKQLTALLPMSSVPIKNNGAEGLPSISIEEIKELREFDVCSVWPWSFIVDLKAGNFKEYTSKDSVGRDFTWQSYTFPPPLSIHVSLTASALPRRQGRTRPVVVHSLDGRPRRPRSSNFRLHVNCARKTITSRNSRSSQVLLFLDQKLTC